MVCLKSTRRFICYLYWNQRCVLYSGDGALMNKVTVSHGNIHLPQQAVVFLVVYSIMPAPCVDVFCFLWLCYVSDIHFIYFHTLHRAASLVSGQSWHDSHNVTSKTSQQVIWTPKQCVSFVEWGVSTWLKCMHMYLDKRNRYAISSSAMFSYSLIMYINAFGAELESEMYSSETSNLGWLGFFIYGRQSLNQWEKTLHT